MYIILHILDLYINIAFHPMIKTVDQKFQKSIFKVVLKLRCVIKKTDNSEKCVLNKL